jgi:hypothetical protein
MTYRVIKYIKGRGYVYEQRTWREGQRVRTESRYIGPLDGGQRQRRGLQKEIAGFIAANLIPLGRTGAGGRKKRHLFGELLCGTVRGNGTHEERTRMGEIAAQRAMERSQREWEAKQKAEAIKPPVQETAPETTPASASPSGEEPGEEASSQ